MKRVIALALICLSLAACANCNIYGDNEGHRERCWLFSNIF